jgi:preprotein translocase subunit SecE
MFNSLAKYFQDARKEIRNVNWPTRNEAVRLTLVVIGFSLVLALFLGLFDYLFTLGLKAIVIK